MAYSRYSWSNSGFNVGLKNIFNDKFMAICCSQETMSNMLLYVYNFILIGKHFQWWQWWQYQQIWQELPWCSCENRLFYFFYFSKLIFFRIVLPCCHKVGNSLILYQPEHLQNLSTCIKLVVQVPVHVSQGNFSTDDENEVVSDADGNFSDADVRMNFWYFF